MENQTFVTGLNPCGWTTITIDGSRFPCTEEDGTETPQDPLTWGCSYQISQLDADGNTFEGEFQSRSGYRFIAAKTGYGWLLAIPAEHICIEPSSLDDVFWIVGALCQCGYSQVDALTLAQLLKHNVHWL